MKPRLPFQVLPPLLLLTFFTIPAFADGTYISQIPIPQHLQILNSFEDLATLLRSPDATEAPRESLHTRKGLYKRQVIKRIGQLGDPKSLDRLRELYEEYENESRIRWMEVRPFFRREIIAAIANIDSPEAHAFVTGELHKLLKDGPHVGGSAEYKRKYAWSDGYYADMTKAILLGMADWNDEESRKTLTKIAETGEYSWSLREWAFESLMRRELAKNGIKGDAQIIDIILARVTGPGEGSKSDFTTDGKTTEAARNTGYLQILVDLGDPALPLLETRKADFSKQAKPGKVKAVESALKHIEGQKNFREHDAQAIRFIETHIPRPREQ